MGPGDFRGRGRPYDPLVEAAFEVGILVAIALPFVRLATCRPFLRRVGGAPELAAIGLLGLVTYAAVITGTYLAAPVLLRPMAVVAVLLAGATWWRARPSFGRGRGLPPGKLRIAPLGPWVDPDYFARDAQRFGPIFKTTTLLSPVICVVGLPAATELFAEHDESLAPPANRFGRFIPRGFIRSMAEADHATYAPILRSAVSGAVTRSAETELRAHIRASLTEAASLTDGPVDVHKLARGIVFPAFYRLFFGIAPTDPRAERLTELYAVLDPQWAWRHSGRGIRRAVDEVAAIVDRQPDDTDTFLKAARRAHPERIGDPTVTKNLVYLLETTGLDVSGAVAWIIWMLGRNQSAVDPVRERTDPERSQAAKRIVMETLRLVQSEYIVRHATRTFSWRGLEIRRGTRVRVCVRESHRDAAVFANPDAFEPDRWLRMTVDKEHYSPFGAANSRSRCLGEGLTLTFGRLFVEEAAAGYDMRVLRDGPIEFSGVHWRPSTKFRIALSARQPATAGASPAPHGVGGLVRARQ